MLRIPQYRTMPVIDLPYKCPTYNTAVVCCVVCVQADAIFFSSFAAM